MIKIVLFWKDFKNRYSIGQNSNPNTFIWEFMERVKHESYLFYCYLLWFLKFWTGWRRSQLESNSIKHSSKKVVMWYVSATINEIFTVGSKTIRAVAIILAIFLCFNCQFLSSHDCYEQYKAKRSYMTNICFTKLH